MCFGLSAKDGEVRRYEEKHIVGFPVFMGFVDIQQKNKLLSVYADDPEMAAL